MSKKEVLFTLMVAIFLAVALSPFASPWPDGLEKVAEDKGFLEKASEEAIFISPIPDYTWPGFKNEKMATGIAGIFGTLIVFGVGYGLASLIRQRF